MTHMKVFTIGTLLFGSVLLAGCSQQAAQPETNDATLDSSAAGGTVLEGSGAEVGAADQPLEATGEVKEFIVEGSKMKFEPNEMRVKKGDTVRVVYKNVEGFHDFVLDEFDVKTAQLEEGKEETVEFVADQAGSFEYYCSVGEHREMGMVGTLIVEE